jgi:hypothetical protein
VAASAARAGLPLSDSDRATGNMEHAAQCQIIFVDVEWDALP